MQIIYANNMNIYDIDIIICYVTFSLLIVITLNIAGLQYGLTLEVTGDMGVHTVSHAHSVSTCVST